MQQTKSKNKLPDEKGLREMCICPNCPTYIDCGELVFCLESSNKSKCVRFEKECLFPSRLVVSLMGFRHSHYCTRENDKIQFGKMGRLR